MLMCEADSQLQKPKALAINLTMRNTTQDLDFSVLADIVLTKYVALH